MSKRIEIVIPEHHTSCNNSETNVLKYFLAGMGVMVLFMKPQILAGVANALESTGQNSQYYNQPVQNTPPIEKEVIRESIVDWDAREQIELIMNRMESLIAKVDGRPMHVPTTVPKAIAKNHHPDKVAAFEAALREQAILEKRAQYHGDDPIVRERMGLSPKRLVNIEDFQWNGNVVGKVEIQ